MNVIETIKSLFSRKKWTYLGTVTAREVSGIIAFNLYQAEDGARKAVQTNSIKFPIMMPDGTVTLAKLKAWQTGANPDPKWQLEPYKPKSNVKLYVFGREAGK